MQGTTAAQKENESFSKHKWYKTPSTVLVFSVFSQTQGRREQVQAPPPQKKKRKKETPPHRKARRVDRQGET